MKSKSIVPLVVTSYFSLFVKTELSWFFGQKSRKKVLRRSILVWIICTFRALTADGEEVRGDTCEPIHNFLIIMANILFIKLITKTCLFKYTENFITKKWKFSDKKILIYFHFSVQNIDCGYSLEPPWQGGSNEYSQSMFRAEIRKIMYTPVNPSFTI